MAWIHVLGVLNSHGIEAAGLQGDRSTPGTTVPKSKLKEAIALLKEDISHGAYSIWTPSTGHVEQGNPECDWDIGLPYQAVLDHPHYADHTELGGALRHPKVQEFAKQHSLLVKIRTWQVTQGPSKDPVRREVDILLSNPDEYGMKASLCLVVEGHTVTLRTGIRQGPRKYK